MTATAAYSIPLFTFFVLMLIMSGMFAIGVQYGREAERKKLRRRLREMNTYEKSYGVQVLSNDYFEGYFHAEEPTNGGSYPRQGNGPRSWTTSTDPEK